MHTNYNVLQGVAVWSLRPDSSEWCVVVCCSVLQCVAVYCCQFCVAECCSVCSSVVLTNVFLLVVCCGVLQCVAACRSVLQCAVEIFVLQCGTRDLVLLSDVL